MVKLADKKLVLKIKLEDGVTEKGKPKFQTLSVKDINPELSENDMYDIANAIADLQKLEVSSISVVESNNVVNEL